MLRSWAGIIANRAGLVLAAGLMALIVMGGYGSGVFDSLSEGGFDDPGSEAAAALEGEREAFGNRSADVVAIYSSDELTVDDPAFRAEVEARVAALPQDAVIRATTFYGSNDPSLVSEDQQATRVLISLAGEIQNDYMESYDEIRDELESDLLRTDVAGAFAVYNDVNEITESDLKRAELISAPIVLILSLLIFRSVVAALMPVMVGVIAVVGSLGVIRLLTNLVEVSIFSINVITLIGLGLAIDYALFMISRYREELARYEPTDDAAPSKAIVTTMETAGRTVLFSGLTVAAAMSSLLIFPQTFLKSMGYGGIAAVTIAMLAALTVLPAVLRLLGRRIDKGRVVLPGRSRPGSTDVAHGAWARLARAVMRRPVIVAVGVTTLLLAVASPFLGVKWGSVDYRVLPPDAPAHVAAEFMNEKFGSEQSDASVLLTDVGPTEVEQYVAQAREVPGVQDVVPVATEGSTTLLRAVWEGNSQTEFSQQVVRDLREVDPPSGEALVGGLTADTVDLLISVEDKLPWMAGIVVAVMVVLLFWAFGSLVLPFKAIAMNIVSITASFGVITWIFAEGNLEGLLGFESQGFLDATQPILMLAMLFGLSMDYEVFLLSRVREQFDLTGDNTESVAVGVQKTGRIITSAALLLGVVIGAFGTSGIVFMKMIGVGMLVALLVDATLVRGLLVPATMRLLGAANWWAPGPLARWWQRHGFREEIST